jgi:hypothetical protein
MKKEKGITIQYTKDLKEIDSPGLIFPLTGGKEDILEYAILLFKIKGLQPMFLSLHELDKIEVDLSLEKRREARRRFNEWIGGLSEMIESIKDNN